MDTRRVAREVHLSKWSGIIKEQKASGLNVKEWCLANGVNRQQYFYWQRQLREITCEDLAIQQVKTLLPGDFVEISAPLEPPMAGVITVRIGKGVVEISGETSGAAIESVIRALRGR